MTYEFEAKGTNDNWSKEKFGEVSLKRGDIGLV